MTNVKFADYIYYKIFVSTENTKSVRKARSYIYPITHPLPNMPKFTMVRRLTGPQQKAKRKATPKRRI